MNYFNLFLNYFKPYHKKTLRRLHFLICVVIYNFVFYVIYYLTQSLETSLDLKSSLGAHLLKEVFFIDEGGLLSFLSLIALSFFGLVLIFKRCEDIGFSGWNGVFFYVSYFTYVIVLSFLEFYMDFRVPPAPDAEFGAYLFKDPALIAYLFKHFLTFLYLAFSIYLLFKGSKKDSN